LNKELKDINKKNQKRHDAMKPKQETSGRREGMRDCGYGGLGERKSFFPFNKQIEEKLKKMCDPIWIQCIIRPVHSINQVAPNCYSKWSTGEGFGRTLTLESTMNIITIQYCIKPLIIDFILILIYYWVKIVLASFSP